MTDIYLHIYARMGRMTGLRCLAVAEPGSAMPPRVNTAFMSHTFDCLAVTLEMPFKVRHLLLLARDLPSTTM